jgi:hemerythrin superfamily protein
MKSGVANGLSDQGPLAGSPGRMLNARQGVERELPKGADEQSSRKDARAETPGRFCILSARAIPRASNAPFRLFRRELDGTDGFPRACAIGTQWWRKVMADTRKMDAVALLKSDHRAVEELFEKFEGASGKAPKQNIAEKICLELSVHAQIEEEIFYPACEGKVEEDLLKESYVEHDGAKVLIAEILAGGPDDEFYDSKVKVLSEEIEHHVQEEEKRMEGLFAQARKAGLDMDSLGDQLAARKQELTAEYEKNGIPKPKLMTMEQTSV